MPRSLSGTPHWGFRATGARERDFSKFDLVGVFMTFSLYNIAQWFHRFSNEVTRELDFYPTYIDDILRASDNDTHLKTLFQCLNEWDFVINVAKHVFGLSEVVFLGFLVRSDYIQLLKEK